jgi:hypothetical protein
MMQSEKLKLTNEAKVPREVDVSSGEKVKFGSLKHVKDLEKRISDLTMWRDKQRKGSEVRANYARLISRLKIELSRAKRTSDRRKAMLESNLSTIVEGGAAGHLNHLWENHGLTFAELKDVISAAAEGKLERASEKTDGMNLVFTFDASTNELRVARSHGDIKRGGMDAGELAKKFHGRGNIEAAFNIAFKMLNDAMTTLSLKEKSIVFGQTGTRWYSIEIIYTLNLNTVSYDRNSIVFHGGPIFDLKSDGSVERIDDDSGVTLLSTKISRMQKAISVSDWNIHGPALIAMTRISDKSMINKVFNEIDGAMSNAGVSDNNTIYDYLENLMRGAVKHLNLSDDVEDMVVERCAGSPSAPSLTDIKKIIPKQLQSAVVDFVKSSDDLKDEFIVPIEHAITSFAIELLRGIKSILMTDSDAAMIKLRAEVGKAINVISSSGQEAAMSILNRELSRLGSIDNIVSPIEGIVFYYKGEMYKFTGSFAPAHQILSLFKYGRKGIPKFDIGEAMLRNASIGLISEGGGAFDDVESISLLELQKIWPIIKNDLEELGCSNIEMIGSTGKKDQMGDIDLAAMFNGSIDDFVSLAKQSHGPENVVRQGGNVASIRYGMNEKFVQVDVMLGDTSYIKWARFGTSSDKKHRDYSPLKGIVRNMLLNSINRFAAKLQFIDAEHSDVQRTRYLVDFDKGLFKAVQTRLGRGNKVLKDWKTISKEFISSDPDVIASIIFGEDTKSDDLRTFENVVEQLKKSPLLGKHANQILVSFLSEVTEMLRKSPDYIGTDAVESLKYIKKVLSKV